MAIIANTVSSITSGLEALGFTRAKQNYTLEYVGRNNIHRSFTWGEVFDNSRIAAGYERYTGVDATTGIELQFGFKLKNNEYYNDYLDVITTWEDEIYPYLFKDRDTTQSCPAVVLGGAVIEPLFDDDNQADVLIRVILIIEGAESL